VLDVDTATAPGALITGEDGRLSVEADCQINASTVGIVRPIVFKAHLVDGDNLQVEFSSITADDVVISVSSSTGQVRTWVYSASTSGLVRQVTIGLTDVSSGFYTVGYRHGRHFMSIPLVIAR
jgi:hypothetical protein